MNKFIEEELKKCKIANVKQVSDTEYVITKQKNIEEELQLNSYYIFEIADYVLHPNQNFTLAENWNKGVIPKSKRIKATVVQTLGKMMKVDAIGVDELDNDLNDVYIGLWLPFNSVKIIKEI